MIEGFTDLLGVIIFVGISFFAGWFLKEDRMMKDLHERGLTVQCIGKIGYHWECEND